MPEHLKVLIVVLALLLPALAVAKNPVSSVGYGDQLYDRHRLLWVMVTLIVFMAHNFWVYSFLCFFAMLLASRRDKNPLALYLFVLCAAPHFGQLLPGFGPVESLVMVNHIRILNFSILLPYAIFLAKTRDNNLREWRAPDLAVLGFLAVLLLGDAINESVTITLRTATYLFIDIWIPYYVGSRSLKNQEQFRVVAAAILVAAVLVSLIAIFETSRRWLLYESLRSVFGLYHRGGTYIHRGDFLRAMGPLTHPIILGYMMMVGIGMWTFLGPYLYPRWKAWVALICLIAGLICSFSRGPWVGAATVGLLMVLLGPGATKRVSAGAAIGSILVIGLMALPFGQRITQYLPFVGTEETRSIDYRARLWDVSLDVAAKNPVFGNHYWMHDPAFNQIREIQGQGLLDLANNYLQVLLPYGLVGLGFFLAALVLPTYGAWQARRRTNPADQESERLGRMLVAVMIGILVTIGTTSNIGVISTIYWLLAGVCVSYVRVMGSPQADDRRLNRESRLVSRPRGPASKARRRIPRMAGERGRVV